MAPAHKLLRWLAWQLLPVALTAAIGCAPAPAHDPVDVSARRQIDRLRVEAAAREKWLDQRLTALEQRFTPLPAIQEPPRPLVRQSVPGCGSGVSGPYRFAPENRGRP